MEKIPMRCPLSGRVFNEITKDAVQKAVRKQPRAIDINRGRKVAEKWIVSPVAN